MKKYIVTFFVFIFVFFNGVNAAQAHVLLSSNDIGVLVHIEPDDEPKVNEDAKIVLDFHDNKNNLTNTNCECNLQIIHEGEILRTFPITELSGEDHSFISNYKFLKGGIYTLKIDGIIHGNETIEINVTLDVEVKGEEMTAKPNYNFPIIFTVSLLILTSFVAIILKKRNH